MWGAGRGRAGIGGRSQRTSSTIHGDSVGASLSSVLGLSHGFINAPIITHIAGSPVAGRIGRTSTISMYRFLERIGHVLGPVVVGQLLIFNQQASFTISWIGGATFVFAMLFLLLPGRTRAATGS